MAPPPEHARGVEPGALARREERQRADAAVEVVLVRHGEPDWAPGGGPTVADADLSAFGRAQAEAAAVALAERGLDALYVSPLARAQQTAEPLAKQAGLTPVTLDGLAEIHAPLAGLSQTDVDAYFRRASQRPLADHWGGWPGGESFRAFHARVNAVMGAILARHGIAPVSEGEFTVWSVPPQRHRIAIVAHGGTNAVALTHLLDVDEVPWEWNRFEMELAAYSVVQSRAVGVNGFVWSLRVFNQLDHLRARGLREGGV
jgi:probable phosphoglycerate mutase